MYTVEIPSLRKWDKKGGFGYVYLGIGATERRLLIAADQTKYKLLGNPSEMKRMAESGRSGVWMPIYSLDRPNWEKSKYPAIENNPAYSAQLQKQVYDQMKTTDLPPWKSLFTNRDGTCALNWKATKNPSMSPYNCIYLPVETFSVCQKLGLNANDPTERLEKHVRLVNPPSVGLQQQSESDPQREYRYDLFARQESTGSMFRPADRQRLVESILTADVERQVYGISPGAGLDLDYLLREKIIKDVYCLHDDEKRQELLQRWGSAKASCVCCFKKREMHRFNDIFFSHGQTTQNLWLLRDYFGESTSMYFGFVEFLIRSTYHLSIVGIGMFVWQIISFFTEIERRNVTGFILATNETKKVALSYLTESCSLFEYASKYAVANRITSTALCPSEYFNLTSALVLYNNTVNATDGSNSGLMGNPNVAAFQVFTDTFENSWKFNSTGMLPFLALCVWIWSGLILVFWRRRQKRYALEWGTSGCENNESLRWSFKNHKGTCSGKKSRIKSENTSFNRDRIFRPPHTAHPFFLSLSFYSPCYNRHF